MDKQKILGQQRLRRRLRVRKRLRGTPDRPRLHVFRSVKHIYCQVIDDTTGQTLASASTLDKDLRGETASGNRDAATRIGRVIAEKALAAGVKQVKLDRGHYNYHGRVAALADAAREAGLSL